MHPADLPRTPERSGTDGAAFAKDIVPAFRPVVLRGIAADWPAVAQGAQGPVVLAKYLHGFTRATQVEAWFAPREQDGRFDYADGLTGFGFAREQVGIGRLFAMLMQSLEDPQAPRIYAGALPLRAHFPGLLAEADTGLIDVDEDTLVSLWLGNGARTAAHWDLPQNLAVTIAGTRRFTLFPPEQVANLYVGPIDGTLAGQPTSLVDIDAPDLARFPRYADAYAHAQVAELGPGDALYVPSMWWHHVHSPPGFGAQINFWWRDARPGAASPIFTLLHALLTLRDLPAHERDAWRAMFDHYVFQSSGDAHAHIPDGARGILGPITPAIERRIADLLIASLAP